MSDLLHLLSVCKGLRVLNLSDTGLNIDKLWSSLIYGGLQLEVLKWVYFCYFVNSSHLAARLCESWNQKIIG